MNIFLALIFSICTFITSAREIPNLTGPVVDEINVLRPELKANIEASLSAFNREEKIQFQVLFVDNLDGDVIENFSIKVAEKWKIGNEKTDQGAIFILSKEERKIRIEVGQGLEGELTDLKSKRIIREVAPYFKNEQYEEGTILALSLMANAVNKEIVFNGKKLKPKHYREKSSSAKLIFFLFVIIAIFQFISPGRGGHFRGSRSGGFGGFSGGGGYSGGGGGWSGGGGGFSGGGASGDF